MIIYPLSPEELDDKALSQQIKAIAQTLCNVHHLYWDVTYPNQLRNHRSGLNLLDREQSEYCLEKIDNIPLTSKGLVDPDAFTNWGLACRANYLKLVDIGLKACREYNYRNNSHVNNDYEKSHKMQDVVKWARDSVPDLRDNCPYLEHKPEVYCKDHTTPFPLVMPKKYIIYKQLNHETRFNELSGDEDIIKSYRNYYRNKIKKKIEQSKKEIIICLDKYMFLKIPKWTRREKPNWLII